MNSSTSHFKLKTISALILTICIANFASYAHIRWFQFENQYFKAANKISDNYATKLKREYANKYVIFGGSTVRTSYIPSLLEHEYGIPLVNAGLHAGFGANVITELAIETLNKGDTLIVALEPSFLDDENNNTPTSGIHFFISQRGLNFSKNTFFSLRASKILSYLKGSTRYHLFMLTKYLTGRKRYRYTFEENLHEDGWMEVFEKRPLPSSFESPTRLRHLGTYGKFLLNQLSTLASEKGFTVYCLIPPSYESNVNVRIATAQLSLEITEIMPVLKDPMLGVNPNSSEFTDTGQHPSRQGAERATRGLGNALATNSFWTKEELDAIISKAQYEGKIEGL